jgi:hypothetical protein
MHTIAHEPSLARALTLREISLIAGTPMKAHPVPGIRLMRRTSHSPACSWTVWPPRIQSFREVLLEDGNNLSDHAIDRMFPGQFCVKDWRSCANPEPSLACRLQPHPFRS